MTGICVSYILGDILYPPSTVADQELLGFAESELGQIFIDRTSQISGKKSSQVLRCDKNFLAERFGSEILHIPGMYNSKNRPDIFFPGRLPGRVGLKTTGELQKYLVALQGQQLWIDWGFLVVKHSLVDQFPEDGSFFSFKKQQMGGAE